MTPGEQHIAADNRRAFYPKVVVAGVLQTWIAWLQWGHWDRVAALGATFVVYVVACVATRVSPTSTVLWLKFVANAGLVMVAGHVSSWAFPTWFFLPYNAIVRDSVDFRSMRANVLGVVVATDVLASIERASLWGMLAGSLMTLAAYVGIERRLRFTGAVLDELAERNVQLMQAHSQLESMHAHAIQQEKLSALGALAAGVAHEINNPMAFVTANVDLLLEELRGRASLDVTLAEYATDVLPATLEGIRRVNVIVRDLRTFARGDPEGMVPYDLNEQVNAALRIMHAKIKEHCELEVSLEPLPSALGMPQQLVQVIINLLGNAVDAHPAGERGTVRVTTATSGSALFLKVTDRGAGLAPEVREKLFQPFFTTKPAGRGTGLGLSVAHAIVSAHSGTIHVESTLGKGAEFTVRLPLEPRLATSGAARDASLARGSSGLDR